MKNSNSGVQQIFKITEEKQSIPVQHEKVEKLEY